MGKEDSKYILNMSLQDKELKNINNHLIWKSSRNGWYKVRGSSPSTTMGVILTFTGKGEREFQSNQGIFFFFKFICQLTVEVRTKKGNKRKHQNSFAPAMRGQT